jgi:hypothetical protein
MHMVRHHHPRTKTIETPLALPDQNGVGDKIGNSGIEKPSRPRGAAIQIAVASNEGVAGCGIQDGTRFGR